jgi:hypothetical protein
VSSARHPSGKEYTVGCVSIPFRACTHCREEGQAAYQTLQRSNNQLVYLQNKIDDDYRVTDTRTQQEIKL